MNDHGNHRWGLTYHVCHPDPKTRPPFTLTLCHSRKSGALEALIRAGATGCSFYDDPAPRWAASILRLRQRGIDIHTVREAHSGDHPGTHGRYYLISKVTPVPNEDVE